SMTRRHTISKRDWSSDVCSSDLWAYKEGKQATPGKKSFEEKLTWFREILDWQNDTSDAEEFMESLKVDLFSDMVYVFTPKGDVIELPSGSVPLDFAYKIHTEIGK